MGQGQGEPRTPPHPPPRPTHALCSLATLSRNPEFRPGLGNPADPLGKICTEVGLTKSPEKSGKSHPDAVFSVERRVLDHAEMPLLSLGLKEQFQFSVEEKGFESEDRTPALSPTSTSQTLPKATLHPYAAPARGPPKSETPGLNYGDPCAPRQTRPAQRPPPAGRLLAALLASSSGCVSSKAASKGEEEIPNRGLLFASQRNSLCALNQCAQPSGDIHSLGSKQISQRSNILNYQLN